MTLSLDQAEFGLLAKAKWAGRLESIRNDVG